MSGYLIDTNVISELVKRHPNEQVLAWFANEPESYLSALSLGELERGAWLLRERDSGRAAALLEWVETLRTHYGERVLPIGGDIISRWARRPVNRTLPMIDSLIAATAIEHGLVVATRNERDFADSGAQTCNPFAAAKTN